MLSLVEHRSPTLEGFRTAFRRPQFVLGEIIWRWSFGVAVLAALAYCFWQYLDSLTVTNAERFLLGTSQPALVGRAISQIFRGSAPRLVAAILVLALLLAFAWIIISSLSRRALVGVIADYAHTRVPESAELSTLPSCNASLLGLNALRVSVALAAFIGVYAAWLAAVKIGAQPAASPGTAFSIFMAIVFLVGLAALFLNWFLSFAAVFVVLRGSSTFAAIVDAVEFCMSRLGAVLAPSIWFGLAHVVLFCLATGAAFFALGFGAFLPGIATVTLIAVITLVYFAVVDFLYLGRLAAYIFVLEGFDLLPLAAPPAAPPEPPQTRFVVEDSRVDPDDLILSDVPVPSQS